MELRQGEDAALSTTPPRLGTRSDDGKLCVDFAAHFAPAGAPDESPERYATLDVVRTEGSSKTTLRAHFYDLGSERGFVLAGLERP